MANLDEPRLLLGEIDLVSCNENSDSVFLQESSLLFVCINF